MLNTNTIIIQKALFPHISAQDIGEENFAAWADMQEDINKLTNSLKVKEKEKNLD